MGSGKGYLTFALYDYLVNTKQLNVTLTGIELRQNLVDFCNEVAQKVGFDGRLFSTSQLQTMELLFKNKNLQIAENCDLIEGIWEDRPAIVANEIYEHDIKYAGQSRVEKITNVRSKMAEHSVENYLITATDDIGWLFNIRGSDVDFNPVTYAFAVISTDEAHLFIQSSKVPTSLNTTLQKDGVTLHEYDSINSFLEKF